MNAIDVLAKATVNRNVVTLPPGQLERDLYVDVKKAIEGIGGKWVGGKTQGFVFDNDPAPLLQKVVAGEKINLKQDYQFFRTPPPVALRMANMFVIYNSEIPEMDFLEPSAGDGALIKAFRQVHGEQIPFDYYELMPQNHVTTSRLGETYFLGTDFMRAEQNKYYDVIIANPPFTNGQDVDHIQKMFSLLKRGGQMVAIASKSYTFNSTRKFKEFRSWLNKLDAEEYPLPAGAFKESGTMIETMMINIRK